MKTIFDQVRETDVVRAELQRVAEKAAPLRAQREIIHARIERERAEAAELSRQIRAIEEPVQALQTELVLAEKKAGRTVHVLTRD